MKPTRFFESTTGEQFSICDVCKVGGKENGVKVNVGVFSVRKQAVLMFNIKCIC